LAKADKGREIRVGDFVKLRSGGATGTVESISRNNAVVAMGQMHLTVKLRDLQHARAPLEIQESRSVQADTVAPAAAFQSKLDIRGMRYDEALKVVEDFVDQALISN